MENQRGRGLSFARRIYRPRIIGLGIGGISVFAALYPLALPGWTWALLLFNGLLWPHLAYQLSTRSTFPYQAERRNLLYDSMLGGFWAATMQFNPLPAVTILSMMAMNNVAAGGLRLFIRGGLAQCAGILLSWLLFGVHFSSQISPLQIYACLPMLTFYPLAVGTVCYRLAIKLSEHKRALSALSRTDSLTGLLNHGSWKDLLHIKFHKCQQRQIDASIALIDIDYFKAINDTYGHIIGDTVLRHLSSELRRNLRHDDLAGRYGGDEFCVILPRMSPQQALDVMERLRQVFSQYQHPQVAELKVSLSIGLAAFDPAFKDPSSWLHAADKALYQAKNSGRNRIASNDDEARPAQTQMA
ncbi:diguanylate cyclase [Pseudomonas sp. Au-Pse12]|uniref:diguanylate cyclase n=1 Tax=Pseudomonas sp. Au-Pse12 TaxID=2906459 RepID=UPI001E5F4EC4|nr:diguanylate cyclase [Pseudomonas sp. Au-Pse12]MCE4054254.1 diguanylate cyclase [Pseudomonas sp. Au-Pse12]